MLWALLEMTGEKTSTEEIEMKQPLLAAVYYSSKVLFLAFHILFKLAVEICCFSVDD